MSKELSLTAKDLQIGDILNGKKIVNLTKRNGFVFIIFDNDKSFSFAENIQITIQRDV
jgi:hypothetical protein